MPILEITEAQIVSLLREMPAPERERVYSLASLPAAPEREHKFQWLCGDSSTSRKPVKASGLSLMLSQL